MRARAAPRVRGAGLARYTAAAADRLLRARQTVSVMCAVMNIVWVEVDDSWARLPRI